MKKNIRMEYVTGAFFILALVSIILVIISLQNLPSRLYPSEVREYNGENLSSIAHVQDNNIRGNRLVNQSTYRLIVTGLVNETKEYSYSQVVNGFQNYEKVVTLYCVEGWNAKILWEGVLVRDVLDASTVDPAAKVVILHAQDGYTTALPVSYFFEHDILLAYKMNGLILPAERGFPFELVAESKYGYKWIKWITQIELSANENYLGYWESRGFSNNADLK